MTISKAVIDSTSFPAACERKRARSPWRGRPSRASSAAKADQGAAPENDRLIERLQAGDEQAFDTVFALYSPKVFKIAHKIVGEAADTEEVVQDVFLTIHRKAKSFRGNAQFSTWLYRLTVNAALGFLRRRKRAKEVSYEDYLPQFQKDGHHLVRPVVDWSANLDECYARQEMHHLLKRALDELRPIDKAVVVLSDLEGLSDKEIADTLGVSVSAAKTKLHRARLFLRGKLAVHLGYSPA